MAKAQRTKPLPTPPPAPTEPKWVVYRMVNGKRRIYGILTARDKRNACKKFRDVLGPLAKGWTLEAERTK